MDRSKKSAEPVMLMVPKRRKVRADPKWKYTFKECPKCRETKVVDPDFGVVVRRGVENAAGWCRECRSKTNYHNRPRKNRTKNNPDGAPK